ncbi:hypothetical protein BW36_00689 [Micrococcus luteus]|nr:hypothetical protein BW36_00689 [Micrococcus luteus]
MSIVIGSLGGIFLWLIYQAIGTRWPEVYATARDSLDLMPRGSSVKYLLIYRGIPTFSVTVLALNLAVESGGDPYWTSAFVFWTYSTLAEIRSTFSPKGALRQLSTVNTVYLSASVVVTTIYCSVAVLVYPHFSVLVPSVRELVIALWTALFASVLAISFQRFNTRSGPDVQMEIDYSIKDIGQKTWSQIDSICMRENIDPCLIKALAAAEAQQRPRWIRQAERVAGRLFGGGTFGVGQWPSSRPIDDLTSIEFRAKQLAPVGLTPHECDIAGVYDILDIDYFIYSWNSDESFADSARVFYSAFRRAKMVEHVAESDARHAIPSARGSADWA